MKTNTSDLPLQTPTWAEIDLDALSHNCRKIRQLAPSSEILAVIKSDGYGHGATAIARELTENGVGFFATATAAEAIRLRKDGLNQPILLLSGLTIDQLPILLDYDFVTTVYSTEFFRSLEEFGKKHNRRFKVHVKVDTGMGRLGFPPGKAREILLKESPHIEIEGVYTHFATSEIVNDSYTLQQIDTFNRFLQETEAVTRFRYIHASNSGGILNYPQAHYNLVRPGLILYGIPPADELTSDFKPLLSLKSKIIFLQNVPKGNTIGYGRRFQAQRDSLVATAPVGYNDGLRRVLTNKLDTFIRGKRCRIAGTVSMDLSMIDVTSIANEVKLYDEIQFLGTGNDAWEWARLCDSIPYEITCLIGTRVPRVYFKRGMVHDIYFPQA